MASSSHVMHSPPQELDPRLTQHFAALTDRVGAFLTGEITPSATLALEQALALQLREVGRNRRHRKMQKTVYRVRAKEHIHNRIALDMLRDSQRQDQNDTVKTLHRARAKAG